MSIELFFKDLHLEINDLIANTNTSNIVNIFDLSDTFPKSKYKINLSNGYELVFTNLKLGSTILFIIDHIIKYEENILILNCRHIKINGELYQFDKIGSNPKCPLIINIKNSIIKMILCRRLSLLFYKYENEIFSFPFTDDFIIYDIWKNDLQKVPTDDLHHISSCQICNYADKMSYVLLLFIFQKMKKKEAIIEMNLMEIKKWREVRIIFQ